MHNVRQPRFIKAVVIFLLIVVSAPILIVIVLGWRHFRAVSPARQLAAYQERYGEAIAKAEAEVKADLEARRAATRARGGATRRAGLQGHRHAAWLRESWAPSSNRRS